MSGSFIERSREYSDYIDHLVRLARTSNGEEFGGGLIAIGTYHNFLKGMLLKYPQYPARETGEKLARDLIEAGGKPVCVLTALSKALSGSTSAGYVCQKSSLQVQKELDELGSVDAVLKGLSRTADQEVLAALEELYLRITAKDSSVRNQLEKLVQELGCALPSKERFASEFRPESGAIDATFFLHGMTNEMKDRFLKDAKAVCRAMVVLGGEGQVSTLSPGSMNPVSLAQFSAA